MIYLLVISNTSLNDVSLIVGYADKDVYVCESRYSTKSRSFKKIVKMWPPDPELVLIPRDQQLELKRVMSVFRERVEKHKDELAELEEQEKIIEKEKPVTIICMILTQSKNYTMNVLFIECSSVYCQYGLDS